MRILFITYTRIGDAVLSTGILSRLIDKHAGARITIACGPLAVDLFRAAPGLERIVVMDNARKGRHWLTLWRRAAGRRWDLVVDLRASIIAYLLRAGERCVFRRSAAPVHRLVQLARLMGEEQTPSPRVWTRSGDEDKARSLVPEGAPVLALAPAANWRGKTWPAERFVELLARLTASGGVLPHARVAVLAAASERALAEPVLAAIPEKRRIDLVGGIDLLAAFEVLRRSALFVGNDSGLMHLAAASGIATLGLFGPSKVEHYAPWGENSAAICTPIPYDRLVGRPGYDHLTTDTLMDSLTVDMVEAAAVELWRRRVGKAA